MFQSSKHIFLSAILFFFSLFIYSQETYKSDSWISANMHYGAVIAHKETMQALIKGHATGAEINIFRTTAGQREWQCAYVNPEVGLSIFYISFANPSELGYGLSLHPYINLPLIKKERFCLSFKLGGSVGYLSKKFDPVTNFKNNAIGSHLNAFVNLRLNAHYLLTDNYRLEFGLGHSHFSNGAFVTPNLGINSVTLNLGVGYKFNTRKHVCTLDTSRTLTPKSKFEIVCIAGGCKAEVNPPTGDGYSAFTLSFSADWRVSPKTRFLCGTELGYNGGNIVGLAKDTIYISKKSQMLQEGIKVGYALRIGALELPAEFGYYIHTLYKSNGAFFHRIGVRYYFQNNVMVNFTLKTHWITANYWEAGIGYVFKRK